MTKRLRQYVAILVALVVYYLVHEGAHFLSALYYGVFEKIRFMGVGVQIVVDHESMTETQLGVFCIVGALATFAVAWVLVGATSRICMLKSKLLRSCFYYTSIALLLMDPAYLSVLYRFFGGGDMNGIRFLLPETVACGVFAALFVAHLVVFFKFLLPRYKASFAENT